MSGNSVKKRIFISNTLMILVTLGLFFLVNLGIIKIYAESIEHDFKGGMESVMDDDMLEDTIKDWTVRKNEFLIFFAVDGVVCILVLVLVSQVFTRNLAAYIMRPLAALNEGAERIRKNDLSTDILYIGDTEFEQVCTAFNSMQGHLLSEQEKNRKYEKARTDMIAGISHDLRTPLTAIRGTIKALLDGIVSDSEKQQKFLTAAYRRTGEMDTLLNHLFYVSKLETGNMPIEMRKINLTEFTDRYVCGKQEILDHNKVDIQAVLQKRKFYVMADPEQLQRILDNLIQNSMKYSEASPLHMVVTLKKNEEHVLLTVSDNGIGVSEEKLPHIFEEFYRGDESRNRKEGNGLGLYIVKYLTEAMGGSVRAENRDGLAITMKFPLESQERMEENA